MCFRPNSYHVAAQNSPGTMDVEMRKIMAVGSGDPAHGATGNPQAKLLWVVGVIAAAGFVAGLLGIGGALIFNPFLLQLGVHPQVRGIPHNRRF